MKACFGIISWLPDEPENRQLRYERIKRLFGQLNSFWPTTDILIITQNWQDSAVPEITNKIIRVDYEKGLGILQARKVLRTEFLKRSYDYLIMFDDDAIIEETEPNGAKKFMKQIRQAKDGFGFLQYKEAQLNGCAISKYIYQAEPMVNIDPQKEIGYEDTIFSTLLHYKYSKNEFELSGIRCTQFNNKNEKAKSTWITKKHSWAVMWRNTEKIINYIKKYRDFPKNWPAMCSIPTKNNIEKTFMGYSDYFGI